MCIFKKKKREKILVKVCNSWFDPDGSHPENARIATEWCPQHLGEYIKDRGPTQVCDIHHAPPPPPPKRVYPLPNPKPSGMPDMVIAVLGILYESRLWSDEQLHSFALRCSLDS